MSRNGLRASDLKFTQSNSPLTRCVFDPFLANIDAPFLFLVVCGRAAAGWDDESQAFKFREMSVDSVCDALSGRDAMWVDSTDDCEEALEGEGAGNVELHVEGRGCAGRRFGGCGGCRSGLKEFAAVVGLADAVRF